VTAKGKTVKPPTAISTGSGLGLAHVLAERWMVVPSRAARQWAGQRIFIAAGGRLTVCAWALGDHIGKALDVSRSPGTVSMVRELALTAVVTLVM